MNLENEGSKVCVFKYFGGKSSARERKLVDQAAKFKLRDRSLFIGGGGGLGEKFKKTPFFIKTPLNKAKNFFGSP